ncbi:hypothetical protein EV216_102200 [Rhodovulum steppense]|uniref:Uncharacterized protein n=1 Tax=Rhodovulum steppense TaxID=540251 RepID=A0A4R1Z1Z0_9RHOB|nr:hypothetical protein EV216_102200 [Rhodovulum steppense]
MIGLGMPYGDQPKLKFFQISNLRNDIGVFSKRFKDFVGLAPLFKESPCPALDEEICLVCHLRSLLRVRRATPLEGGYEEGADLCGKLTSAPWGELSA